MTQDEFDFAGWGCGMHAEYMGSVYAVVSVNFQEKLVGLYDALSAKDCDDADVIWVRCENMELVK